METDAILQVLQNSKFFHNLAEKNLRQVTKALSIGDRVHFYGFTQQIDSLLPQLDIFVLPSLSEGMPLAVLEAMAARCAVIASNVGKIREMLDNGDAGMLVPPGSYRQGDPKKCQPEQQEGKAHKRRNDDNGQHCTQETEDDPQQTKNKGGDSPAIR